MARIRTFEHRVRVSGTLWRQSVGTVVRTTDVGWRGRSEDTVGRERKDNALQLWKTEERNPVLNGSYYNGANKTIEFTDCPFTRNDSPEDPKTYWDGVDGSFLSRISSISLETTLKTSPSQPHLLLGQSLYELRDLPSLIRTKGMCWLEVIPAAHLSWRFAIAPMISDVKKLLSLQLAVMRRFNYLVKLSSGRWVKKRVTIGKDARAVNRGTQIRQSNGALITARKTTVFTKKEWVSTSWKLDPFSNFRMPADRRDLWHKCQRLCLGVNGFGAFQAAWELIPWSWLIDWYMPVGDYIASMNNSVPALQSSCCYMRTSTSLSTYDNYVCPVWVSRYGKDFQYMIRKERIPFSPNIQYALPPSIPLLQEGQLSILRSLAFLKGVPAVPRRYRRKMDALLDSFTRVF